PYTTLLRSAEVVQAPRQGVEVADGVGDGDGLAEPVDALLRLRGLDVGGADPLLQQADLGDERVELALEVGQGLFGRTGLPGPDDALTVGRPDVHGAVRVRPAPGIGRAGHPCLLDRGSG